MYVAQASFPNYVIESQTESLVDDWHSLLDVPYRVYRKRRAIVLSRSDRCHICGGPGATEVDHVIPLQRGGTSTFANLKPAHGHCNRGKAQYETPQQGISPTKSVVDERLEPPRDDRQRRLRLP
jgi:5-methylcytosine-specific restriction endonuclease McrA